MEKKPSIQYGDDRATSDPKHTDAATASGPYAGLSFDDADHMRKYEGKVGKRVVRKVRSKPILASNSSCKIESPAREARGEKTLTIIRYDTD